MFESARHHVDGLAFAFLLLVAPRHAIVQVLHVRELWEWLSSRHDIIDY